MIEYRDLSTRLAAISIALCQRNRHFNCMFVVGAIILVANKIHSEGNVANKIITRSLDTVQ